MKRSSLPPAFLALTLLVGAPLASAADSVRSLNERAAELQAASPERIAGEVRQRARQMGVRVPVAELVTLLERRAWLLLDLEGCRLEAA